MADGKVVYEIRGDNSKFQSDVNETEKIAKSKTTSIGGFAKTAVVGIGTAVAATGAGMIAFGKDAIGVGSDFDTAMSQVAATMGVTVDEIDDLRQFAMDMGATTAFSANEAAQALNYMALAGYDAETSMKMLPNVLNLAAAGNMDLARASDMVTDTQSALGLSLNDTAKLVDKMAKASSKSNTSVEQLGDAMLTVGGTAKDLKGGTTELATVLGVLADNGIKGAEGGTALRNVILALSAPTDKAAEKLDELGVSAYDADGNLRALPDIFADLNGAMDGMTQGEKTDVLNMIFNKVDLKSANALLATSAERFDDLSSAIDGATGAAEQMATTQLDNLNGDITLMKSALEGAKISLSNRLTPALRKFVQMGTKEIGKLDNAFQKGGINGLAEQLGKSLSTAVQKLVDETPKFVTAAGNMAFSMITSMLSTLADNFPSILRSALKTFRDLAHNLGQKIPEIFKSIGSIVGETIANIPNILKSAAQIAKDLIGGIIKGIGELASGVWESLQGLFSKPLSDDVFEANKKVEDLKKKIAEVGETTDDMAEAFRNADKDAKVAEYWLSVYDDLNGKVSLTKEEQNRLNTAVDNLKKIFPELGDAVQDETGHWDLNTQAIRNNIDAMKARAKAEVYNERAKELLAELVDLEEQHADEFKAYNDLIAERDLAKYDEEISALESLQKEASKLQKSGGAWVDQWAKASPELKKYAESVGITADSLMGWDTVAGYAWEDATRLKNAQKDLNDRIDAQKEVVDTAQKAIDEYNNAIDECYGKAIELESSVSDANDTIGTEVPETADEVKDAIVENADKAADAVEDASDRATDKLDEMADGAVANGEAVSEGVADGIRNKLNVIEAAAENAAKCAVLSMKKYAQISSPSKRARAEVGKQIGAGEALGLEDSIPDVEKASEKLINAVELGVNNVDVPSMSLSVESDTRTDAIIAVLNKYLPRIGAPIVLDTGELVGATVGQYDHELGILQQRRARYE